MAYHLKNTGTLVELSYFIKQGVELFTIKMHNLSTLYTYTCVTFNFFGYYKATFRVKWLQVRLNLKSDIFKPILIYFHESLIRLALLLLFINYNKSRFYIFFKLSSLCRSVHEFSFFAVNHRQWFWEMLKNLYYFSIKLLCNTNSHCGHHVKLFHAKPKRVIVD